MKKALYRLPVGRAQRRAVQAKALVLYLLLLVVVAEILTQRAAHQLRFVLPLGEPWLELSPRAAGWCGKAALATLVLGLAGLAFSRLRRLSPGLLGLAGFLAFLAQATIYTPAHLLHWAWTLRADPEAAPLLRETLEVFLAALVAGAILVVVNVVRRTRHFARQADVHGSAHWADDREVEVTGLLGKQGLLLGLFEKGRRTRYLRHDGPEHVFVFAPTRSGKGVGLVLPNLLSWPRSVLVHDIKGENWALSAGWRREALGSRCLRFDPTDIEGASAAYNPLFEIRRGSLEVRDAQNVADILVDPNGDRLRDHWDRTAHAALVGVILHVLYAEPNKTLNGCACFLTQPETPVEKTLQAMMATEHDPGLQEGWTDPQTGEPTPTHPVVASAARALLDKSANERSGVLSTALSFLDLYRDPILARNTATSDFTLEDLMQHERPVSLYLTVPSSDLSRTRPLVRMLLNQALRRLTESMRFAEGRQVAHYRHPLLLMLDEFPALGRLAFFQDSLAFLAGYGIRACLITQDLSQHYGVYGSNESITGNCHVRVAFSANKPETAELLSRMAGEMTVHLEQRSYRGDRFDFLLDKQQVTLQQTRRRLLTPDEAMRLPAEDALIFVGGHPPIRATKIRYYDDRTLAERARIPAPAVSDLLPRLANPWIEGQGHR